MESLNELVSRIISWCCAHEQRLPELDALSLVKKDGTWEIRGADKTLKKELDSCAGLPHGLSFNGGTTAGALSMKDILSRLSPRREKDGIKSALSFPDDPKASPPYVLIDNDGQAADQETRTAPAMDLLRSLIGLGLEDFHDVSGIVSDDWVLLRGISSPLLLIYSYKAGAILLQESRQGGFIGLSPLEYAPVPQVLLPILGHFNPGCTAFMYLPENGRQKFHAFDYSRFNMRVFDFRLTDEAGVECMTVSAGSRPLNVPVRLRRAAPGERGVGRYSGVIFELELQEFMNVAASIESELSASGLGESPIRKTVSHAYLDDGWTAGQTSHNGKGTVLLKVDGMLATELLRHIAACLESVGRDVKEAGNLIIRSKNARILQDGWDLIKAFMEKIGDILGGVVNQKTGEYAHPLLERLLLELGRAHGCRACYYRVTHPETSARYELYVDSDYDLIPRFPMEDARVQKLAADLLQSSDAADDGRRIVLLSHGAGGALIRCIDARSFLQFDSDEGKLDMARIVRTTPKSMAAMKELVTRTYGVMETELDCSVGDCTRKWFEDASKALNDVEWKNISQELGALEAARAWKQGQVGLVNAKVEAIDKAVTSFDGGLSDIISAVNGFQNSLLSIQSLKAASANAEISPEQIQEIRRIPHRISQMLSSLVKPHSLARLTELLRDIKGSLEEMETTVSTLKDAGDIHPRTAAAFKRRITESLLDAENASRMIDEALRKIQGILGSIRGKV